MSEMDRYEDFRINNRWVSYSATASYLWVKLIEIFTYEDLPITTPKRVLEKWLTQEGSSIFYEYEGGYFLSKAKANGPLDVNGDPTMANINHINGITNVQLVRYLGVDAVLIRNDSECISLDSLVSEFSILTAQAKITLLRTLVDLRSPKVFQAKDQKSYESVLQWEESQRAGDIAVILAEEMEGMEGLTVHNTPPQGNGASQAIEIFQYISSHYYSELGININNNMKKQYVSDTEVQKTTGIPLINNMLQCRREALRDINAMFDLDIKVKISDEWDDEENQDANNDEGQVNDQPQSDTGAIATEESSGSEDSNGSEEPTPSTEEASSEGVSETSEPGPEVEPITKEELLEATEAITGEVAQDEEDNSNSDADGGSTDTNSDKDKKKRDGVES